MSKDLTHDELRAEYQFDYSQAKPNRFAAIVQNAGDSAGSSEVAPAKVDNDGNQVNAKFLDAAGALVELKKALLQSTTITEIQKLDIVADIDSIQSQLAKSTPNRTVIQSAWEAVRKLV